jgi:hypothetical protein
LDYQTNFAILHRPDVHNISEDIKSHLQSWRKRKREPETNGQKSPDEDGLSERNSGDGEIRYDLDKDGRTNSSFSFERTPYIDKKDANTRRTSRFITVLRTAIH